MLLQRLLLTHVREIDRALFAERRGRRPTARPWRRNCQLCGFVGASAVAAALRSSGAQKISPKISDKPCHRLPRNDGPDADGAADSGSYRAGNLEENDPYFQCSALRISLINRLSEAYKLGWLTLAYAGAGASPRRL